MTPEERIQRAIDLVVHVADRTVDPYTLGQLEKKERRLRKQQAIWANARSRGFKTTSPNEKVGQYAS
jgi:hypothetical protein